MNPLLIWQSDNLCTTATRRWLTMRARGTGKKVLHLYHAHDFAATATALEKAYTCNNDNGFEISLASGGNATITRCDSMLQITTDATTVMLTPWEFKDIIAWLSRCTGRETPINPSDDSDLYSLADGGDGAVILHCTRQPNLTISAADVDNLHAALCFAAQTAGADRRFSHELTTVEGAPVAISCVGQGYCLIEVNGRDGYDLLLSPYSLMEMGERLHELVRRT